MLKSETIAEISTAFGTTKITLEEAERWIALEDWRARVCARRIRRCARRAGCPRGTHRVFPVDPVEPGKKRRRPIHPSNRNQNR